MVYKSISGRVIRGRSQQNRDINLFPEQIGSGASQSRRWSTGGRIVTVRMGPDVSASPNYDGLPSKPKGFLSGVHIIS